LHRVNPSLGPSNPKGGGTVWMRKRLKHLKGTHTIQNGRLSKIKARKKRSPLPRKAAVIVDTDIEKNSRKREEGNGRRAGAQRH